MKKSIDLAAIVEALELHFEGRRAFLDTETAEIHDLGPEELAAAETDDTITDYPDWQQPLVELARQVFSDSSSRYIELPDQWEVNEYRALEGFASSQADSEVADQLHRAIHGPGAFRRFKDAIHRLGLADRWYDYRRQYLREIARGWCEANEIHYQGEPS